MPRRPEKGALIVFCAITASVRLTAAADVSRLARARIEVGLRGDALGDQVGLPLVGDLRLLQRRLVAGEVRQLDRNVELDELGAFLHVLAALNGYVHDHARDLGGDVDALRRDQRADRGQVLDPLLGFCGARP